MSDSTMSNTTMASLAALNEFIRTGAFERAIQLGESLIARNSGDLRARLALATAYKAAGRTDSALQHYDIALGQDDTQAQAWFDFALLLQQVGERDAAMHALQRHLALSPQHAAGWFALGQSLLDANRVNESEAAFARAVGVEPALIEQRFKLGMAAMNSKQFDIAAIHFHAATTARPDWLDAQLQLGHALLNRGRHDAAYKIGLRATQLAPNDVRTHELQALALELANANPAQLLPIRQRLAEMLPQSTPHQFLYAIASSRAGRYDLTHAAFDRTLQLHPGFLPAIWARFQTPRAQFHGDDASIARYIADWDSGIADVEALPIDDPAMRARLESSVVAQSNFYLGYTATDVTARQLRYGRLLRRIADNVFGKAAAKLPRAPVAGRRLKVGFITPTLRHHTVIKLFGGLMQHLPRDRFEVFAYGIEHVVDDWTENLRQTLDHVRIIDAPLTQIAASINADQLDAIVYLDIGMHARSACLAATRLAPFQAVLWGHPVTTGLDTVDAFLSCAAMEPALGDAHYSERVLRLPALGCWYDPTRLKLQPAQMQRIEDDRIRILCVQSASKLLPIQDELFARILAANPRIDLICLTGAATAVLPAIRQRICDHIAEHGIDVATRVQVLGSLPEAKFLEHLWQADIALDAIGWSGGVTALETFWGDVPIVTVPGEFMRGGHTFAMLERMDLPELIATDGDDYVRKVLALAADDGERTRLRGLIAARKHLLYRNDEVVAALAELLQHEVTKRIG